VLQRIARWMADSAGAEDVPYDVCCRKAPDGVCPDTGKTHQRKGWIWYLQDKSIRKEALNLSAERFRA